MMTVETFIRTQSLATSVGFKFPKASQITSVTKANVIQILQTFQMYFFSMFFFFNVSLIGFKEERECHGSSRKEEESALVCGEGG